MSCEMCWLHYPPLTGSPQMVWNTRRACARDFGRTSQWTWQSGWSRPAQACVGRLAGWVCLPLLWSDPLSVRQAALLSMESQVGHLHSKIARKVAVSKWCSHFLASWPQSCVRIWKAMDWFCIPLFSCTKPCDKELIPCWSPRAWNRRVLTCSLCCTYR